MWVKGALSLSLGADTAIGVVLEEHLVRTGKDTKLGYKFAFRQDIDAEHTGKATMG